jgi:hypothetical protein
LVGFSNSEGAELENASDHTSQIAVQGQMQRKYFKKSLM